jgi:hypothetical protein
MSKRKWTAIMIAGVLVIALCLILLVGGKVSGLSYKGLRECAIQLVQEEGNFRDPDLKVFDVTPYKVRVRQEPGPCDEPCPPEGGSVSCGTVTRDYLVVWRPFGCKVVESVMELGSRLKVCPIPTPTANLSYEELKECAIQLVQEEYDIEVSEWNVSKITTDQVRVQAEAAYNSWCDSIEEACGSGGDGRCDAFYVDVLVESSGDQCKVVEDRSFHESIKFVCPTPTSSP